MQTGATGTTRTMGDINENDDHPEVEPQPPEVEPQPQAAENILNDLVKVYKIKINQVIIES